MMSANATPAPRAMDVVAIDALLRKVNEALVTVKASKPRRYPVLVADDDPGVRELLRSFLSEEGYTVDTAADGVEAVERVRRAAEPYLFAFVDVKMPGQGSEAIARMSPLSPETLIIVITGGGALEDIHRCFHEGGYTLLRKPFDLDAIRRALPSYEAAAAERREAAVRERARRAQPAYRKGWQWLTAHVFSPRTREGRARLRTAAACGLSALLAVALFRGGMVVIEEARGGQSRIEAFLDSVQGALVRGEGYLSRDEQREIARPGARP